MLRLPIVLPPVTGDPIVGYISLGSASDPTAGLPQRTRAATDPERFTEVALGRRGQDDLQASSSRRRRGTANTLLEGTLSRPFAEDGQSTIRGACVVSTRWCAKPLRARGVGDTKAIDGTIRPACATTTQS